MISTYYPQFGEFPRDPIFPFRRGMIGAKTNKEKNKADEHMPSYFALIELVNYMLRDNAPFFMVASPSNLLQPRQFPLYCMQLKAAFQVL